MSTANSERTEMVVDVMIVEWETPPITENTTEGEQEFPNIHSLTSEERDVRIVVPLAWVNVGGYCSQGIYNLVANAAVVQQ